MKKLIAFLNSNAEAQTTGWGRSPACPAGYAVYRRRSPHSNAVAQVRKGGRLQRTLLSDEGDSIAPYATHVRSATYRVHEDEIPVVVKRARVGNVKGEAGLAEKAKELGQFVHAPLGLLDGDEGDALVSVRIDKGELFDHLDAISKILIGNEKKSVIISSMFYQMVLGLKSLYENDIFHTDMKTENCLLALSKSLEKEGAVYSRIKLFDIDATIKTGYKVRYCITKKESVYYLLDQNNDPIRRQNGTCYSFPTTVGYWDLSILTRSDTEVEENANVIKYTCPFSEKDVVHQLGWTMCVIAAKFNWHLIHREEFMKIPLIELERVFKDYFTQSGLSGMIQRINNHEPGQVTLKMSDIHQHMSGLTEDEKIQLKTMLTNLSYALNDYEKLGLFYRISFESNLAIRQQYLVRAKEKLNENNIDASLVDLMMSTIGPQESRPTLNEVYEGIGKYLQDSGADKQDIKQFWHEFAQQDKSD